MIVNIKKGDSSSLVNDLMEKIRKVSKCADRCVIIFVLILLPLISFFLLGTPTEYGIYDVNDDGRSKGTAVICTAADDFWRYKYLEDFARYHTAIGFRHIYYYDISGAGLDVGFDRRKNLKDLPVTGFSHPEITTEQQAYDHCIARIQQQDQQPSTTPPPLLRRNSPDPRTPRWIGFFGLDEYVVMTKHTDVRDLLEEVVPNSANGLALNWVQFDFNNQMGYEPEPLPLRFTRREVEPDRHVKVIARTANLIRAGANPHYFEFIDDSDPGVAGSGACLVDTDRKRLCNTFFNPDGPTDLASLYHYDTKSVDEFLLRCDRAKLTPEEQKDRIECNTDRKGLAAYFRSTFRTSLKPFVHASIAPNFFRKTTA